MNYNFEITILFKDQKNKIQKTTLTSMPAKFQHPSDFCYHIINNGYNYSKVLLDVETRVFLPPHRIHEVFYVLKKT